MICEMSSLVVARKIHAYQQDDAVAALAAVMHKRPNVAT